MNGLKREREREKCQLLPICNARYIEYRWKDAITAYLSLPTCKCANSLVCGNANAIVNVT